jgi:hypothetical protein
VANADVVGELTLEALDSLSADECATLQEPGDVPEDLIGQRFVLRREVDEGNRLGPDKCGL